MKKLKTVWMQFEGESKKQLIEVWRKKNGTLMLKEAKQK